MSQEIGQLRAALSANAARFEQDMQKAKHAVQRNARGMETSMGGVRNAFNSALKTVKMLAVAAGAAAVGLGYMVKKQIDAADAAAKNARAAGTTVEVLTAMQHAAELSGVSQEALSKTFIMTARYAADTARGTGEAKDAYEALNISVVDANGKLKNSEDLIMEVADKFKDMEDGAGKTALAVKIFGRSGAAMINMLNNGSAGIREMMAEAKQLGLVLDTNTAEAAERFNDNLTRLQAVGKGWINQIMAAALPTLEQFTDRMVKSAKETDSMSRASQIANTALKLLLSTATFLIGAFDATGSAIGGTAAAMMAFVRGDFKGGWETIKNVTSDYVGKFKDTVSGISDIWSDEADDVKGHASDNAKKLAAPIAGVADEVKKESEKAQKAIEKEIETLQFQAATYGKTTAEITLYRLALAGANEEQLKAARLALDDIAAKTAQAEATEKTKQKTAELEALAKSYYESTLTEAEKAQNQYNATIKELNDLLEAGAISMGVFSKASQKAADDLKNAGDKITDTGFVDDLEDAFSGWASNMSSTLNDVLWDADATFGDIATSFGKMITQMIIQTQILKPMMKELFGGEEGGGLFGKLFGGGGGTSGGGGGGWLDSIVGLIGSLFHEGGKVGVTPVPMRLVSPEVFARAPRLHQGLLPDEYPAILKKYETVRTPEQEAALHRGGGGRGQIVNHWHITTPDASSFRASQGQIMRDAGFALRRWGARNG